MCQSCLPSFTEFAQPSHEAGRLFSSCLDAEAEGQRSEVTARGKFPPASAQELQGDQLGSRYNQPEERGCSGGLGDGGGGDSRSDSECESIRFAARSGGGGGGGVAWNRESAQDFWLELLGKLNIYRDGESSRKSRLGEKVKLCKKTRLANQDTGP